MLLNFEKDFMVDRLVSNKVDWCQTSDLLALVVVFLFRLIELMQVINVY